MERALRYQRFLDEHPGASYAVAAAHFGVTREEVCQYVTILRRLPVAIVGAVRRENAPKRLRQMSLRKLLRLARMGSVELQEATFERLFAAG